MRRQVWPYRRPMASSVHAQAWRLVIDGQSEALPDALPHWDYQTSLDLERQVEIDLDAIWQTVRLREDARVGLSVVWASSGSGLREPAGSVPLGISGTSTVLVRTQLPGDRLGGTITLRTLLTVLDPGSAGDSLAPRRAGSILWSDEVRIRLQGDAPQFPIAVVDFAKTSFPDNATWHLDLGTQLEAASMGTLLLYISESKKAVVQAFKNAASPRPSDRLILSAVYADIARVMIETGLNHPDLTDDTTYEEDTLGRTLQNLIWSMFPGRTIADLRQLREHSPNQLATQIQAAVGIFEEP